MKKKDLNSRFSNQLIIVLKSIYYKTTIALDSNCKLTQDIPITKGVRQGCTISPSLFITHV